MVSLQQQLLSCQQELQDLHLEVQEEHRIRCRYGNLLHSDLQKCVNDLLFYFLLGITHNLIMTLVEICVLGRSVVTQCTQWRTCL